ncbi:hypothetical protein P7C73_g5936, partial [Tremellales sp. Uapishka_1]
MSGQDHQTRVLGGYKAALHNPNVSSGGWEGTEPPFDDFQVSEEAKAHAAEVLAASGAAVGDEAEHEKRVLAGYKATLHNPNASDAAKQKAEAVLLDAQLAQEEHERHVLGGYKGTLSNPHTSTEAKIHAAEKLDEAGVL